MIIEGSFRNFCIGALTFLLSSGFAVNPAKGQETELIVDIADSAVEEQIAELRSRFGVYAVRNVPELDAEIWAVANDRIADLFEATRNSETVSAIDYLGFDQRSLFIGVPELAQLSTEQVSRLADIEADEAMEGVQLLRLRAGEFGQRLLSAASANGQTNPQPSSLLFNFGLDGQFLASRTRFRELANGVTEWTGSLTLPGNDMQQGTAFLVIDGDDVLGRISSEDGEYLIQSIGDGYHAVAEIDSSAGPPDHDEEYEELLEDDVEKLQDAVNLEDLEAAATGDGRIGIGFLFDSSGMAAIRRRQQSAAQFTSFVLHGGNQIFQSSGATAEMYIAGIEYLDRDLFGSLRSQLLAIADPKSLDHAPVGEWRGRIGADIVVLVTERTRPCGYALDILPEAAMSFVAVSAACAIKYNSLTHEIGHVLGLTHHNEAGLPALPFGRGYRLNAELGTLMALRHTVRRRAPRWSSPEPPYQEQTIGVHDSFDSVRAINTTARIVSEYR
ncbi:MAG: hypothetical protein AAFW97_00735 [Pseudomonadota bacterium]